LGQMEKKLGRRIPETYRAFLLKHNGGYPNLTTFDVPGAPRRSARSGSVKHFLGIGLPEKTENLEYALDMFAGRIPGWLFPIARDPGGNIICVAAEGPNLGKVYMWDHEYEAEEGEPPSESNIYVIAPTLSQFLGKLRK